MRRCMDDVGVLFHAVPWDRYSRHQRHRHCSGYTVGRKHRGHLLLQFATCTSYKKNKFYNVGNKKLARYRPYAASQ